MTTIYEDLEDTAGHKLTLIAPMTAGVSTYYCELCGAVLKLSYNGEKRELEVVLFHVPDGNVSTKEKCSDPFTGRSSMDPKFVPLRDKLTRLMLDGFTLPDNDEDMDDQWRKHVIGVMGKGSGQ